MFHSPVTFHPFVGREDRHRACWNSCRRPSATSATPTSSTVDGAEALVFRASVGDRELEGIDLLRFNADGLIGDFTVFIRPLSGAGPVRPGDGREGRRGGPADEPRLRRRSATGPRARRASRAGCSGSAPTSASAAPTCRRRVDGARGAGVEVLGELLDLRHRPGRRGARPAELPERLPAGQTALEPLELLDAVKELERELGRAAGGRPPRPARDRHRHAAAGGAASCATSA